MINLFESGRLILKKVFFVLITPLTHVVMLRDKLVPKILSRILIGNVCYIFSSKVKNFVDFLFQARYALQIP